VVLVEPTLLVEVVVQAAILVMDKDNIRPVKGEILAVVPLTALPVQPETVL